MGSDASREHLRGDGRRYGLLPLCHYFVNIMAQKSKKRGHTRKDGVKRTFAPDRIEYHIQISDISLAPANLKVKAYPDPDICESDG
jgi:hypothetical protein